MTVFVYGTLMRGMSRHRYLKNCPFLGTARVEALLYDLGRYPGIKAGKGDVIGELYDIDAETLERLDEVEGYAPDDEASSLYLRRTVKARFLASGRAVEAVAYFYNRCVDERQRIAHGDYRQHHSSMRERSKKL